MGMVGLRGWLKSCSVICFGALSIVAVVESTANACSEIPNELSAFPQWPDEVAKNGVLVFDITLGEMSIAEAEANVDVEIEGFPELRGTLSIQVPSEGARAFGVWRLDEGALPQGRHTVVVTTRPRPSGDSYEVEYSLEVEADAIEPISADEPSLAFISNSGQRVEEGRSLCCEWEDVYCSVAATGVSCTGETSRILQAVTGMTGLAAEHEPYSIIEVYEGVDGVADDLVLRTGPSQRAWEYRRVIEEEASEYCTRFRFESLLDGTIIESDVACVAHVQSPHEDELIDLDDWVEQTCAKAAYWEESGEAYAPNSGCSVGGSWGSWGSGAFALLFVLGRLRRRRR